MKAVLFLGAGFSRAWCLPVMEEFFQYAKDCNHIDPREKDFLRGLQVEAAKGTNM